MNYKFRQVEKIIFLILAILNLCSGIILYTKVKNEEKSISNVLNDSIIETNDDYISLPEDIFIKSINKDLKHVDILKGVIEGKSTNVNAQGNMINNYTIHLDNENKVEFQSSDNYGINESITLYSSQGKCNNKLSKLIKKPLSISRGYYENNSVVYCVNINRKSLLNEIGNSHLTKLWTITMINFAAVGLFLLKFHIIKMKINQRVEKI